MDIRDILRRCDHTLLRRDCTEAEIAVLCDEAIRYECASVCIPPCHVGFAKKYAGDALTVCTVIGFPNGYNSTQVKLLETGDAINAGAGEIQVALDIEGVWNAIATEPWIMIVSGYNASSGSGLVRFSYTDNNTGKETPEFSGNVFIYSLNGKTE